MILKYVGHKKWQTLQENDMEIDYLFKYALVGWLLWLISIIVFVDSKNKLFNAVVRIISWLYSIPLTFAILKSFNLIGA